MLIGTFLDCLGMIFCISLAWIVWKKDWEDASEAPLWARMLKGRWINRTFVVGVCFAAVLFARDIEARIGNAADRSDLLNAVTTVGQTVENRIDSRGKLLHPLGSAPIEIPPATMPFSTVDMVQLQLGNNKLNIPNNIKTTAFSIRGHGPVVDLLSRDGKIFVSTTVLDETGKEVVNMAENEFSVVNGSGYRCERDPGDTGIRVFDQNGGLRLEVVLRSRNVASLRGLFWDKSGNRYLVDKAAEWIKP